MQRVHASEPPKVSYYDTEFGRVKIVRRSLWCKLLGVKSLAVWNRIYVAERFMTHRTFRIQVAALREQREIGILRFWMKCLTS